MRIVEHIQTMETLGQVRPEQYSTLFLVAAASGLRIGELLALRDDDVDFGQSTIRVDESVDRTGVIGPWKNVAAVPRQNSVRAGDGAISLHERDRSKPELSLELQVTGFWSGAPSDLRTG